MPPGIAPSAPANPENCTSSCLELLSRYPAAPRDRVAVAAANSSRRPSSFRFHHHPDADVFPIQIQVRGVLVFLLECDRELLQGLRQRAFLHVDPGQVLALVVIGAPLPRLLVDD